MIPRLNWHSLCDSQKQLAKTIKSKDTLIFTIQLKNGQTTKRAVEFKNFLQFFWYIDENKVLNVQNILVTDFAGNTLYQYANTASEKLPPESLEPRIKNWNQYSKEEKESYLKILYAQLNFHK